MSSTYRILCLNHDPAIVVDGFETRSLDEAVGYLQLPNLPEVLPHHASCDLVIGRYSYPLVEVICPPQRENQVSLHPWHPRTTERIDSDWLRLLWAAHAEPQSKPLQHAVAAFGVKCWTWPRINRLRFELNIENHLGVKP